MRQNPLPLQIQGDPALIEAKGVRKSYGSIPALKGIDLSLPAGGVGLIGPNGAGKTTLIKILLGLLRPDAGDVRVFGLDPSRQGRAVRARIGFVPEDDCYWEGLTAVGSVQFAARLNGLSSRDALRKAHGALDRLGVEGERYRLTETLSMGMRQRVRLAQAVVHEPELLILDEPTRFMDPIARLSFSAWLKELRRDGVSVVVSTHEIEGIEEFCNHIVFILDGNVHKSSNVSELLCALPRWELSCGGDPEIYRKMFNSMKISCEMHGSIILFSHGENNVNNVIKELNSRKLSARYIKISHFSLSEVIPRILREEVF